MLTTYNEYEEVTALLGTLRNSGVVRLSSSDGKRDTYLEARKRGGGLLKIFDHLGHLVSPVP